MKQEDKKPINVKIDENSFELSLRILSNEFVAIKIGSTNFSGKLIAGGILLLFFNIIYFIAMQIIAVPIVFFISELLLKE